MDDPTPETRERDARDALHRGNASGARRLVRALAEQADYAQALSFAMEAVDAAREESVPAWHAVVTDIALCCSQLGTPDIALPFIDRIDAELAKSSKATDHGWRGLWLSWLDRPQAAIAAFDRALSRFANDAYLLNERARCRAMIGDRAGIAESRVFASAPFWAAHYADSLPLESMWHGEPVVGRRVLVLRHGGIGDSLQFVRYASVLIAQGAREVVLESPHRELHALLASFDGIRVVGSASEVSPDEFDCWTSTFGLGLHLFADHGFQTRGAYLSPPPSPWADSLVQFARGRARGRRCIGLWWHSDAAFGLLRSAPLAALLPLFGLAGVHWVVFQRGVALRQLQASGLDALCTVVPDTSTFADQARLLGGLDGMVSIDAYALHMAGALGRPTWMLAGRYLDWRYLDAEDMSPLYPQSRICRQPRLGDWRGAVRQLCDELG
jgi:tetratricopeptide (TPR) repeat protein